MLILVCAVIGLCGMVVAYALGLGGSVGALIFLAILLIGVFVRVAQPLADLLRP